jgi:hypothetical protein
MDNKLKIFASIAIALSAFAMVNAYAQNVTINQTIPPTPEPVATGQDAVPAVTANGSVVEVAPADSIDSLLTTIFTVAIPAVIGLATAIAAIVRSFAKDKKSQDALDTAIAGFKYADTLSKKVYDNYVASGASKTASQMIIDRLEPDQKAVLQEQTNKIPDVQKKLEALTAQINKLKSELPDRTKISAIADNDKSLGQLDKSVNP